jgi:hypothetical protein
MEGQRPRLPVFVEIHQRGIARQKAEQADKERREEEDRTYWRDRGKIDHNLDNSKYSDHETDSDSGGGKKNHTNKKYTMKMRKNKKSKKRWSLKYKKSINCNRPRGFSQRQYCKYGRKKS